MTYRTPYFRGMGNWKREDSPAVRIRTIHIEVIPHRQHRYETCGDYYLNAKGELQIRVSDLGDILHELPIVIHELVEWALCQQRGVRLDDIDAFDQVFEMERALGKHSETEEPGDHPDAPYRDEHRFAENIERLIVQRFGLQWRDYEDKISDLR